MDIRPTRDRALCRPVAVQETYPGSPIILVPGRLEVDTAQQAEVVAVGPGYHDEDGYWVPADPDLKPGVWVLHEPHRRVEAGHEDYFWLRFSDITAILDG